MGKARIFSDTARESVFQKEFDDEVYNTATQQNSYNLGSVHFSDQSGIANISQGGADQRKASLKGALYTGNIGFVLQTVKLDVATSTINLNNDSAGVALSVISTDRFVTLSTGTTSDLTTITGAQRPGHRLRLYNTLTNTITVKHTAAATVNTIRTPDAADLTFPGNGILDLTFDTTTAQWRVVSNIGGSSGLSEPISLTINTITPQTLPTKSIVDWSKNPNEIALDRAVEFEFSNIQTSGKYQSVLVIINIGSTVGFASPIWPSSVLNPPTIPITANTRFSVLLYTTNNGTVVTHATSVGSSSSGGGTTTLSGLTIDVNKNWAAQGISNFGALTGVTGIDLDGTSALIQGVKELRFFDDDPNKNIKSAADQIAYNTPALDQHSFYAGGVQIARFIEVAANVYKLNMLVHSIDNAKDIVFDNTAGATSFAGTEPAIGYNSTTTRLILNMPAAANLFVTNNNTIGSTQMNNNSISSNIVNASDVLQLGVDVTVPTVVGEIRSNGTDVTVFSGGTVRNLSNIVVGANTTLSNLGTTAINADLLFGATGRNIGATLIPVDNLFVEQVRFISGTIVTNRPMITSVGGNTLNLNVPLLNNIQMSSGGVSTHVFSPTSFTTDNIIVSKTLTINSNATNPDSNGQFTRNVNVVGLQADSFDVRRDSTVVSGEPAELSIRKLANSINTGVTIAAINFQTGISTATTWARISAGPIDASGTDNGFLSFNVRADNGLISALALNGDDNNQRFQLLCSGTSQFRIQPVFDRMGYFVTPQVTDFSLVLGTAGSLEIPRLANNSPSLTDLNQAFGAFDGAFGYESVDERLYVRESSSRWVFFAASGAVT